jgi:putative ABC transport system permease protein
MKIIQSVFSSIGRSPVKSILTFITVGIGVGVLILALGMSGTFNRLMESQLQNQGLVVSYANAELSGDGEIETLRPPQSDSSILDIIGLELAGVEAVSPVAPVNWSEFNVDGTSFTVRSVLGVNEQYASVMGLELLAGSLFTAEDVEAGAKSAVITESLAEGLFGSSDEAIGETLQPPAAENTQAGETQASRGKFFSPPTYTVTGVVSDPSELQRNSYGIADMIVPYTSAFPAGGNFEQAAGFFSAQGVILVRGETYETVEAQLREVLSRSYGDDFVLQVWEGGPNGSNEYLSEMRGTVETFSLVVNLLGFILLAAASIGILSIMLVEALGRSREIAIERALGASKGTIIKEFITRSALVTGISVAIGIGLSFVLSGPITDLILPIFSGVSSADLTSVLSLQSVLIGSASALLIGGVFGVLPAFSVLNAGIADTIREG